MARRTTVDAARARARALRARGDDEAAHEELTRALGLLAGPDADPIARAMVEADLRDLLLASETRSGIFVAEAEPSPPAAHGVVGTSAAMAGVRRAIGKAAASDAPLLIEGESGTGKELVARAVHAASGRAPFVAVASATLSHGLVEAELFGHAAGAFTGATRARQGLLAESGQGTMLLDLVDELPLDVQAKLLRALELREVRPVGGGDSVAFAARVIATSRRRLSHLVAEGAFRADLYFRLNVLRLELPPLRARREDVPALAACLLARHAPGAAPALTARARERLAAYPWPGNVRELENELRRLLLLGKRRIDEADLSSAIREGGGAGRALTTGTFDALRGRTLEDIERAAILSALRAADGNRSEAARSLGISRRAIYDKMRRLGIDEA